GLHDARPDTLDANRRRRGLGRARGRRGEPGGRVGEARRRRRFGRRLAAPVRHRPPPPPPAPGRGRGPRAAPPAPAAPGRGGRAVGGATAAAGTWVGATAAGLRERMICWPLSVSPRGGTGVGSGGGGSSG